METTSDSNTVLAEGLKVENAPHAENNLESRINPEMNLNSCQVYTETKANQSWLNPILRRDSDFENTGKPRLASSNSLSNGMFRELQQTMSG